MAPSRKKFQKVPFWNLPVQVISTREVSSILRMSTQITSDWITELLLRYSKEKSEQKNLKEIIPVFFVRIFQDFLMIQIGPVSKI